jgi:ABC-type nitrate/sulfonate/bicarbonate transport system ATPase subunit
MPGAPMLDAKLTAKRLPSGEILLRDVAVSAAPGDIVALLGVSGTGKTTLLRILLGLDRDCEGVVRNAARRVGVLFQEPRLLPWRTIGDNIRLAIPRGGRVPDLAVLLRDLGLPGVEPLYPRQISLGMARRAALARALAITPDLLVLDEPLASLDPSAAGLVAARLVRERQAALIVTMHDAARATLLATRIIVLAGRPATVAYQVEIAADADLAARASVHGELMRRFPFLTDPSRIVHDDGLPALPVSG